jgi:hypothetical protein
MDVVQKHNSFNYYIRIFVTTLKNQRLEEISEFKEQETCNKRDDDDGKR